MSGLLKLTFQGLLYPKRFIEGRLKNGEGAVLVDKGKRVAVYKSIEGKIDTFSPVCTHLGCIVDFNRSDKTRDCPCHGSRYKTDGTVLNGPAKKNLKKI